MSKSLLIIGIIALAVTITETTADILQYLFTSKSCVLAQLRSIR